MLVTKILRMFFKAIVIYQSFFHLRSRLGLSTEITRPEHLLNNICRSIRNINLFKTPLSDETSVHQQRIYTLVYLLLFISTLGTLLFYNAVIERAVSETVPFPSIANYEHLRSLYPNSVNCPCAQISIPYHVFVTELYVNFFHQACSTRVVYLGISYGEAGIEGTTFIYGKQFKSWKGFFVDSLAQLCALAQDSVNNSIAAFSTSTILVNQVMSHVQFMTEINEVIYRFQRKTAISFGRTLDLIRTTIQGNALTDLYSSSWTFVVADKDKGNNVSFLTVPITYNLTDANTTCSCATSRSCATPAQVLNGDGTTNLTIEGLVFGCYILETVLQSSLSCFHSLACINGFRRVASRYSPRSLERYHNRTGNAIELNASLSRFHMHDKIETIAHEMFIESWISNVSYERFFNSCAPRYCIYSYHYRFDALDLLTTFLSVFGGLSVALRFITPYLIKVIKNFRHKFRVRPLQ